jgi:16S rRNA (guanine966-N2)-methyltransferase
MRIIAGKSKGRHLRAVPGIHTRPTTDKVKEAIFSMIGPTFNQEWVLDLFAGTGGLGIEALSRGAKRGIFIDMDSKSIEVVRMNLRSSGFEDQAEVYRNDAERALKALHKRRFKFDLIFLDPPYRINTLPNLISLLRELNLLNNEAIIVCEHSHTLEMPDGIADVDLWKQAQYGDTTVTVYQARNDTNDGGCEL